MDEQILIKRLTHIKLLFEIARKQSLQKGFISSFSILGFHDCIEMFLRLVAEKKEVRLNKINSFIDYWNKVENPQLTSRGVMEKINQLRNNFKHHGNSPSTEDIELVRVSTINFFEENSLPQLNIGFKDVSLFSLVEYEKARHFLKQAQSKLDLESAEGRLESIENSAKAFKALLLEFQRSKYHMNHYEFFNFGSDLKRFHINNYFGDNVDKYLDGNTKTVSILQDTVKIISLGLDYGKYSKFKYLTPSVNYWYEKDSYECYIDNRFKETRKINSENCKFCIDFVIDSAIQLQSSDFDIEDLSQWGK